MAGKNGKDTSLKSTLDSISKRFGEGSAEAGGGPGGGRGAGAARTKNAERSLGSLGALPFGTADYRTATEPCRTPA